MLCLKIVYILQTFGSKFALDGKRILLSGREHLCRIFVRIVCYNAVNVPLGYAFFCIQKKNYRNIYPTVFL